MTVFEDLMLYGPGQQGEDLLRAVLGGRRVREQEEALREAALEMARRLRLSHVLDNLVTRLSGGSKEAAGDRPRIAGQSEDDPSR